MFKNAYVLPFKLLGIPVRLDISFLFILALFTWVVGLQVGIFTRIFNDLLGTSINFSAIAGGATPYWLGFLSTLGLFVGVAIHELGHAVVARRYGVEVKDITLMFLGGVVQFNEMPRQRGAEAIVGIAGPITSLLVAAVSWVLLQLTPAGANSVLFVLGFLTFQNVFLAIFNLLPALPLDGGRVLRSLLALRMPYLRATQISATVSRFIAILMGIYGILSFSIILIILAFFIYSAVRSETQYAQVSELLSGVRVRDLMTRDVVSVEPGMPVEQLIKLMFFKKHLGYPVLDGEQLVGMVKLQHAKGLDDEATVGEIMSKEVNTIAEDQDALEAFKRINQNDLGRLVVVDAAGKMVGILSKTDLVRSLQVQAVGNDMPGGPSKPQPNA